MNLYRISQEKNNDYDTYDSAVVCAESEDDARRIHPCDYKTDWDGSAQGKYDDWAAADDVKVELIGTAIEGLPRGVVCASFNAG